MATNTLQDWFETPLGQYLLEKERAYLDDVTPDIFGFHALQLGLPRFDLLRDSRIAHRMRVACSDHPDLYARCHELPFATQSIDLVLLPHALEFAEQPHAILREVDRVMMPEGRLVILGFNPWSLWGLRGSLGPSRAEYPWNGRFVSLLRVKDWLALLGFDVSAGRLACYAPPFDNERVRGMRLITPAWQEKGAREKAVVAAAKRQGAGPTRADEVIAASKPAAHLRIVK